MRKKSIFFILNETYAQKSSLYFIFCIVQLMFFIPSYSTTMPRDELHPLHPITVEAQATHSITLSWNKPELPDKEVNMTGISIHYSSTGGSASEYNQIEVPVNETSKLIGNLEPGTNYTFFVTAHYSNNKTKSSKSFIMSTLESINNPTTLYRDCSCFSNGTKSCEKLPTGAICICKEGYRGPSCDVCSPSHFLQNDLCHPCSCPPETSSGSCHLGTDDSDDVVCECKTGYSGIKCDVCITGFFPAGNHCVECHCLACSDTSQLQRKCDQCPEIDYKSIDYQAAILNCGGGGLTEHPNRHEPIAREDGTVAIIAVVICLAFIGCVAGFITCYTHRMQSRNQLPFWSIELAEDKISLNTNTDYRHLGGSSKSNFKSLHQRSSSVVEATVAQRAADQPQYNCISI